MKTRANHGGDLRLLLGLTMIAGCLEGGANNGGNRPGNKEGGTNLAFGEIAVHTNGRYFLSRANGALVIGDLERQMTRVADDLPSPFLVGFWPDGAGIFLLSLDPDGNETFTNDFEVLVSYDLESENVVWTRALERQDFALDIAPSGAHLIVSNGRDLVVIDTETGHDVATIAVPEGIADIDLVDDRILLTERTRRDEETRLPWTSVEIYTMEGINLCEIEAPNCASDLVITEGGERGFLAPTFCGRDPVSVLDLEDCRFVTNLPGFGPVALSPDGATAVAFLDRDAEDPRAPPRPAALEGSPDRYHLMFIDVEDLTFDTRPLGAVLPRYTFTPDGRALVVDSTELAPTPVVLIDVAHKTARTVEGPMFSMHQYVLTPDGRRAFAVDMALFELDVDAARADGVPLSFQPSSINITADGDTLLLKDHSESGVYLFEIEPRAVSGRVDLDPR